MVTIEARTSGRGRAGQGEGPRPRDGGWSSPVTSYYLIGAVTALLLVLGLVMVLSSSTVLSTADEGSPYAYFIDQATFAVVGLIVLAVASRLRISFYKRIAWPALALGIVLQALVYTPLGRSQGGNRAWVYVPGLSQTIQPSEFLKVALVIWLAAVLAAKQHLLREPRHVLVPAGIGAALAIGLVALGKDLGTVLILVALAAGAFYAAHVPMRMLAVAGGLAAGAVAVLTVSSENRMVRLKTFLGLIEVDPQNGGYQTLHGLWGLGTGGISGVGLGASREKWLYLPEAHNDFIFAVIGEELGLLGTLLVLVLFGTLAVGFRRVIMRHTDPFVRIATAAAATWILVQAIINIGVVIGWVPVIGVPLPLLSQGGSALITNLAVLGMVLAFARSEPGASEALEARRGAVRRSLAVVGRRRRRG